MKLRIQKTRQVKTPTRSHQYDAGLDFYIPEDMPWDTFTIWPGTQLLIPTGIKADIPEGFALFCFERSSMATKGLICGARVCDAEYQGEIHMHVMNPTKEQVYIKPGQKLAQFILMPVMNTEVVVITDRPLYDEVTDRGEGGFGSTGTGLPPRTDYKWDIQKAIEEQKTGKGPMKLSTPEGDGITYPKPNSGTSGVAHAMSMEHRIVDEVNKQFKMPDGFEYCDQCDGVGTDCVHCKGKGIVPIPKTNWPSLDESIADRLPDAKRKRTDKLKKGPGIDTQFQKGNQAAKKPSKGKDEELE